MKLNFAAIEKTRWFKLVDDEDAELAVVPSEAHTINTSNPFTKPNVVCRLAFVDFKNLEDNEGKPLENTLENRIRIYKAFQDLIDTALLGYNAEVIQGEESAASD
jgi:hypothetical protein